MVRDRWVEAAASPPRYFCDTDIWHHYTKVARQFMRGWGANLGAELRARKGDQIKAFDEEADAAGLSADDWLQQYALESSLMEIFKCEELFWQRRGGQKWPLEGDANTAYFQAIANGHR